MKKRNLNLMLIVYSILIFLIFGCIGGGTHGAIKLYQFNTTKYELEGIVNNVFAENIDVIKRDSTKDYYNNDSTYITFHIKKNGIENEYTIRYYGNKQHWDTATVSAIGIAYAYTKDRRGGSAGNDGVGTFDIALEKELVDPFEKEFVSRINSKIKELKQKE